MAKKGPLGEICLSSAAYDQGLCVAAPRRVKPTHLLYCFEDVLTFGSSAGTEVKETKRSGFQEHTTEVRELQELEKKVEEPPAHLETPATADNPQPDTGNATRGQQTSSLPQQKSWEGEADVGNSFAVPGIGGGEGLSRERRMRPPDFRSILQSNDGSAPAINPSFPGQSDAGGLVLRPLGSLDAPTGGMNVGLGSGLMQPTSTGGNPQPDTSNAVHGFASHQAASIPQQKSLEGEADVGNSFAVPGIGGGDGLSRERRMRPPDFRSILQSNDGSAPAITPSLPGQSNAGGLVLRPLGSLDAPTGGMNVGLGSGLMQPTITGGNQQPDASNAVHGLASQQTSSLPQQKSLEGEADVGNSFAVPGIGGGEGLSRERRMRPPDFRSILQSNDGSAAAINPSLPGQNDAGGLVLRPLGSLDAPTGGMNIGLGSGLMQPTITGGNPQPDTSNAVHGLAPHQASSIPQQKPLQGEADVGNSFAVPGIGGGDGLSRERRMRPPDFRSILQSNDESAAAINPSLPGQNDAGGLVLRPLGSLDAPTGGINLGVASGATAGLLSEPAAHSNVNSNDSILKGADNLGGRLCLQCSMKP